MEKVRKFFTRIIGMILTRQIGIGMKEDDKIKFEKDVLKLLAKYKCFKRNTKNILHRATIIVDVDELPVVNLKLIALENELQNGVWDRKTRRK